MDLYFEGTTKEFMSMLKRVIGASQLKVHSQDGCVVKVVKKGFRKKVPTLDECHNLVLNDSGTRCIYCDCEDFTFRHAPCKHMMLLFLERGILPSGVHITDDSELQGKEVGKDHKGRNIYF